MVSRKVLGEPLYGFILRHHTEYSSIPVLVTAYVQRLPTPGLYIDDAGAIHVLGETFFIHEYSAYIKLRGVLRDLDKALLEEARKVEVELENVSEVVISLSSQVLGE